MRGVAGAELGTTLRRRLSARGLRVIAITGPAAAAGALDCAVESRAADLRDPSAVRGLFEGADAVIHLAAHPKAEMAWPPIYGARARRARSLLAAPPLL